MYRMILFRLSESYFRHRWLYLLPIMLMIAFAAGYLFITKPTYSAQGILYIQADTYLAQLTDPNKTNVNYWTTPAQMTSGEINELIQTDAFIRAVIQETNLEKEMSKGSRAVSNTIDAVRKNLWVLPQGENQVLVGAKNSDSQVAIQLANGVIDNYIRWHTNSKRNDSEVALSFFTNLIGQYRADLDKARNAMADYIRAHPLPLRGERTEIEKMEIASLQSDITQAETRYSNAMDKEENARLSLAQIDSESKQTFTVIDAPHIPTNSLTSKKDIAIKVGIFAAIGLLLSGGLIIGTALFDHSFLVPSDVQAQLDLPVLAIVPDGSPSRQELRRAARKAKEEAKNKKRIEKQLLLEQEAAEDASASTPAEVEDPSTEAAPEGFVHEPQTITMEEHQPVLNKASL